MALRGRGPSFRILIGKCQSSRPCEVGEMVLWKVQPAGLTILVMLDMYDGAGQLSKWMVDGWSQVSHYWSGNSPKQGQELRIIFVVMDSSWRLQCELPFNLIWVVANGYI